MSGISGIRSSTIECCNCPSSVEQGSVATARRGDSHIWQSGCVIAMTINVRRGVEISNVHPTEELTHGIDGVVAP